MLCNSVRDAIALQTTDLNYGLQPMAGDSVKMHVLLEHYNQLQLTLEECHAVTPNGIRVEPSKLNMNDCLNGAVITIYCDSPLKNDETITAIASKGAIVGKINVMKNSHYQDLTVNVYVIKSYLTDKNYTNDYGKKVVDNKLSEIGGLQAIKNYLNKKKP